MVCLSIGRVEEDLEVVEICYFYQKRDVGKPFIRAFARRAIFLKILPCCHALRLFFWVSGSKMSAEGVAVALFCYHLWHQLQG